MSNSILNDYAKDDQAGVPYYLIVVEAFKFDDVRTMNKKAPCAWATFIAVQVDHGRKYSDVFRD